MKRLTKRNRYGDAVTFCDNCPKKVDGCYDGADCVDVLVERLAIYEDAGERGGWISVNECLPYEGCGDVLLTDGEDCYVGYYRSDAKCWDNCTQGWVKSGVDENGNAIPAAITHWQPLPRLPLED